MLAKSKWTMELRRFLASASTSTSSSIGSFWMDSSDHRSKAGIGAAIGIGGVFGVLAAYYGLKREKKKEPSLVKKAVGHKFSLHAAAVKTKKKNHRSKLKQAALVVGAAITEATAVFSSVTPTSPPISFREKRFLDFASIEYEGQAYMTPSDFLEAVVHDSPKEEHSVRRNLDSGEAERMLDTRGKPSKEYFRSLGHGGLISYTEYLFLLCILTKPHSSFRVAYNMLDADSSQYIDKKEFLVMERIFANTKFSKKLLQGHSFEQNGLRQSPLQPGWDSSSGQAAPSNPPDGDSQAHLRSKSEFRALLEGKLSEKEKRCDTTLMRRFFGRRGRHVMTYEEFYKFMDDLQTEILEVEFHEFSNGQSTIKEKDFARLLLRYAFAHREQYLAYMKRIEEKIRDTAGITFEQYQQFCLFLTNLDDFAMAVKLYTFRDLPVTQKEFARAAQVSTGLGLDPHIVNTVFQIFDINEDGRLSYGEFISVMRDRLHRGAKRIGQRNEWQLFKKCVREEIKRY